jgi:hypothetical protein
MTLYSANCFIALSPGFADLVTLRWMAMGHCTSSTFDKRDAKKQKIYWKTMHVNKKVEQEILY